MNYIKRFSNDLIRETTSSCPNCQKDISANIVERNGKIIMEKACPAHGEWSIILSKHPDYYKEMSELYFNLYHKEKPFKRFFLYFTNKCNLNCPICSLGSRSNIEEMGIKEIEDVVRQMKKAKCMLYGAEPTCREDLFDIIRLINKYSSPPDLFTNGLKFSDLSYVKKIKEANPGMIYLQFDGFKRSTYELLRGRDILDEKLKAIENLEKIGIPIILIGTLAKGINDDEIESIIKFACTKVFVKGICWVTMSVTGNACFGQWNEYALSPDESIDRIELQSKGKISREYFCLFQKILFIYSALFKERICFFLQQCILFKKNGEYFSLNDIFDTKELNKILNKHIILLRKKSRFAWIYLFLASLYLILFKTKNFRSMFNLFCMAILRRKSYSQENADMPFSVAFHDGCELDRLDMQVIDNCDKIFVYKEEGNVRVDKTHGDYLAGGIKINCKNRYSKVSNTSIKG